jgi:hypothetical protein
MDSGAAALQRALEDANKARAMLYVAVFGALERRFGRETAVVVLKEAIRDWGRTLGGGLRQFAPDDWDGLTDAFVMQPDGGAMFRPAIESAGPAGLEVHFRSCPLKAAWLEAGLAEAEVALLCEMAAQADHGTLEAGGFAVDIETWRPGRDGCCRLRIRPPATAGAGA